MEEKKHLRMEKGVHNALMKCRAVQVEERSKSEATSSVQKEEKGKSLKTLLKAARNISYDKKRPQGTQKTMKGNANTGKAVGKKGEVFTKKKWCSTIRSHQNRIGEKSKRSSTSRVLSRPKESDKKAERL